MNENEDILSAYQLVKEGMLNKVLGTAALAAGSVFGSTPNADAAQTKPTVIADGKYIDKEDFQAVQALPNVQLTNENYKSYITSYIKNKEGFRKLAYLDPSGEGKWCVGYGFELNGSKPQVAYMKSIGLDYKKVLNKKQAITEDQGTKLLVWYIDNQAIPDCITFYPDFPNAHPNIKAALIDLSYNAGLTRMLKYKGLKVALLRKDFIKAAFEYVDSKEYSDSVSKGWAGKVDRINKGASLIYNLGKK